MFVTSCYHGLITSNQAHYQRFVILTGLWHMISLVYFGIQ